jgi:hypothetical protein
MPHCLHCVINELVQKRLELKDANLAELAAKMAESLADLILLAPPIDQAILIADVASSGKAFGQ